MYVQAPGQLNNRPLYEDQPDYFLFIWIIFQNKVA